MESIGRNILSIITVSAFDLARLKLTLESIPSDFFFVEHIVVVPRRDTETLNFLESYKPKHNQNLFVIFESKSGIYPAMNDGLSVAQGDWVLFLNSGDLIAADIDVKEFTKTLGVSRTDWIIFQGIFLWRPPQILTKENLLDFVRNSGGYISHQTVLARKELLNKLGGFNPIYKIAADTDLITKMSHHSDPVYSDIKLTNIEFPCASSANNRRGRVESMFIALRHSKLRDHPRIWKYFILREVRSLVSRLFKGSFV